MEKLVNCSKSREPGHPPGHLSLYPVETCQSEYYSCIYMMASETLGVTDSA